MHLPSMLKDQGSTSSTTKQAQTSETWAELGGNMGPCRSMLECVVQGRKTEKAVGWGDVFVTEPLSPILDCSVLRTAPRVVWVRRGTQVLTLARSSPCARGIIPLGARGHRRLLWAMGAMAIKSAGQEKR